MTCKTFVFAAACCFAFAAFLMNDSVARAGSWSTTHEIDCGTMEALSDITWNYSSPQSATITVDTEVLTEEPSGGSSWATITEAYYLNDVTMVQVYNEPDFASNWQIQGYQWHRRTMTINATFLPAPVVLETGPVFCPAP